MSINSSEKERIFQTAADIECFDERAFYLAATCDQNAPLRAEIEELLRHDAAAQSFLNRCAVALRPAGGLDEDAICEAPGDVVGPYQLTEQIGEGAFGRVFVAQQEQPVRRKVAIKFIRPGMDTREVIGRFDAERQALALMDHPHIAKVIDAGATESGRPYFVMDLVQGVPITEYCDQCNLSTRERLELFMDVCQAVQHAHQKGIIHRDVKPTNVLVTNQEGLPTPKVIDFGIAKAIDRQLTEVTLTNTFAKMVGTPLYMSPEQAELCPLGVDTRSDIYSLGVLLYELLTGTTPFDRERLKAATSEELQRIIREEKPPRPSARISTIAGNPGSTVAQRRRTDPRRLVQAMRGDLDWIVMKCLEKDRNRRYESASALARDLERFINNEPVEARSPSLGYKVSKFTRRNAGPIIAAGLMLLCLIGGIVGTSLGMVEARRERDAAESARQKEKQQRQLAEANANRATRAAEAEKAVLDFVENRLLAAARPEGLEGGLGYDATVRQAVEAALPFVDLNFQDRPLLQARLQETIGRTFLHLGDGETAAEQFQAAHSTYAAQRGPDAPATLAIRNRLAECYDKLGRYEDALRIKEDVHTRRKATLGVDHLDTVGSMAAIADTLSLLGRHSEAAELNEQALSLFKGRPGVDFQWILACTHNLGNDYRSLGRLDDAVKLHEDARALSKASLGADHPDTLAAVHELAHSYQSVGRHEEAHALLQETYDLQEDKLGPDHPDTWKGLHCLAKSHVRHERFDEALEIQQELLARREAKHGAAHPATQESMYYLAISHFGIGDFRKAHEFHKKILDVRQATLGEDDPKLLASHHELALCQFFLGQHDEAIQALETLLARFDKGGSLGPNHAFRFLFMHSAAQFCLRAERLDDAVKHAEKLIEVMRTAPRPNEPMLVQNMKLLADRFRAANRFEMAAQLYEIVLPIATEQFGGEAPATLSIKNDLDMTRRSLPNPTQTPPPPE